MTPLVIFESRRKLCSPLNRSNRIRLGGAIILGGIGPLLLLMGLQLTTAGSVSLILNLEMAVTAILGVVLFRENLSHLGWLGVIGIVGTGALASFEGGWPGIIAGLLVGAACVCWGFDNHLTALIDGITPAQSTFWKGWVAGGVNLTIGVSTDSFLASWETIVSALCVGALCYGASIALYIACAQQLGATRAQGLFASAPFFGLGLSVLVLGESFGALYLVGSGLLIVSVGLLFFSQHTHEHVHEPIEHLHSHRHDEAHHLHEHPDLRVSAQHTHWHRHERTVHAHPHWPDLQHRHAH